MFYVCLTLLTLVGSLVLGNPWYTRNFALIIISEMYIIFIRYVTNPTRHHIGVQIRTTDALHTLAYQVIPTSLNRRTQQVEDLPQDYQVSRNDLYVEDILFVYQTPANGLPNMVEDEVHPALPPYWCNQVLLDAAQCMEAARPTSLGGWCRINLYLMYNLLVYQLEYRENWRTLKGQSGIPLLILHLCAVAKFEFQTLRSMWFSVQPYVPRSQSVIWVMKDGVAEHLEATSLPLHHL